MGGFAAEELDLWGLRVARNNTEVFGEAKLPLTGMG